MRRVRRKGGNKEKVFGCDLLEHLTASCQEVPQVLQCCSDFVEKHGIVDGIYRLSGVSSNIQKLRGEFENDGSPDLNKDLYLQDIHCVSSLCKAYFRELPNPLLTYQLYDKFAEAVAIQLEEERLVKIRDVLKELPAPHYRTLEFLMRHLVKMASYSSETNMHSRNLAIVWAPNLLRSKDIEASGFNGTAAFMEVRVQSIVVEFILTHVPQLFPEQGASYERRKSLPSPSAILNQEEGFYKSAPSQPVHHFGNISPGDGPLPIRPYHAIIEGTDKRKGSLKGRKWMSIFNIGGRFPDPRRRHKHSAKEKERPALRPARSMDSLSTSLYSSEDSRRSGHRPPSTNTSPLVTSSPQPGSDVSSSTSAIGGSEYAVTYRRGTGLVSGGAGTQGTYTSLDPDGLGLIGNETLQSRSPGLSSKGRRAAMHITGPTMVTVPLHITSNLALGVLQGGGGDRVIHRGRDKEGGDRVEGKEGKEGGERKQSRVMEMKAEERGKVEEEEKTTEKSTDVGDTVEGGGDEGKKEEEKQDEEKEVREERLQPELVVGRQSVSREQQAESLASKTEGDNNVDDEYMEMKGVEPADCHPEATQPTDDCVFDASDVLNSTQVERDNQELSGYVQDNFEFLDQMDCSVLDHMDCSVPYQVNEFSVEPPGHSDDEYEVMDQAHPPELQVDQQPGSASQPQSPTELNPHRPLSLDSHSRHTKSLSLPYMTSPVHGSEGSCSEEEAAVDDSEDDDYSSEEDESMFIKSLPADFFLDNLTFEPDKQDGCAPSRQSQSSDDPELSAWKQSCCGDLEQVEVEDKEETDELEEEEIAKQEEEDHQATEQLENNRQSKTGENQSDKEEPLIPEASTLCCVDFPPLSDDESVEHLNIEEEEEEDMFDHLHSDYPPYEGPCAAQSEVDDVSLEDLSVRETEQTTKERDSDEGEMEDIMVLQIKESEENRWEETAEECSEVTAEEKCEDEKKGGDKETSGAIWVELEDVVCEVIEDEESKQVEIRNEGSVAEDGAAEVEEEEEQEAEISGEEMVDVDEAETKETEVRVEVVEESSEMTEEKLSHPETQQDCEAKETSEGKHAKEEQHHDREEVVSKENDDEERAEEERTMKQQSVDKPPSCDTKELIEETKCEGCGVGRKLVISKHPRVYQVKAVPVVPPKPQHCKITALTLRQQQQQREKRDVDRWRVPAEREKDDGEDDGRVEKEKATLWGGERGEQERRRDGEEGAARGRNSPLSISFDEAVAIATMRREKEKESEKEKEKERQRDWGNEVQ